MFVTVELDTMTERKLVQQARDFGLPFEIYVRNLLSAQACDRHSSLKKNAGSAGLSEYQSAGRKSDGNEQSERPFKTGRGLLAKYGPAPTADEIDENRREMLRGFPEDPQ